MPMRTRRAPFINHFVTLNSAAMTHNNDTYITDTEDNVNKLQSDGDVTVPKEKFLFREPIVLISIVGLSLLDGLVLHLTPKNLAEYPTEVFTVYSLSVSAVPMVGLIFATLLSEVAGRRHVYRYLFALSVVLFILVVSSRHPTVMIMVFILRGMIRGGSSVMNAVAICEYSSPKHRFAWMIADVATANTIGPVISSALNTEIVFYTLLVIQIVLGLICMRCIWAWPESPYWLANKGNLEQSRTAFMWLRGKGGRKELDSVLKARRRPGPPKLFWISLFIALATVSVTTFSYVQQSTGHKASPNVRHCILSSARRIQLLPAAFRRSSLHLAGGRPTLRLPSRGLHSRTRLLQRLLILRQIWPAYCHFNLLICLSYVDDLRSVSEEELLSLILDLMKYGQGEKSSHESEEDEALPSLPLGGRATHRKSCGHIIGDKSTCLMHVRSSSCSSVRSSISRGNDSFTDLRFHDKNKRSKGKGLLGGLQPR
ncbi:hypothetical protein MSG28_012639 [Choristoneura fumiferana]|uniref:Uncharacterized protein n=1 Tax=Choristoneura fumiferana TaxID=7141 RepID=A0ACC0JHG2_CHOFU|nr:hypothetical protein MSG28_012639 [Choristoneura fumiferana]